MLRRGRLLTVVGVCLAGFALPFSTMTASALTTSTNTLTLTAGALSVSVVSAGSTTAALSSTSPAASSLAVADWADTTGSGAGWNGTMAVSLFNYTGTWVKPAGQTNSLTNTTSGVYTGTATQGYEVVTVTSDVAGTAVSATVTGTDAATLTSVAHNTPIAVGTHGATIQFDTGVTYANGDKFTIHFGNLPNTALVLGTGTSSVVTPASTTTAAVPTFTGNTTVVTGGASPTAVGSGVKFVTAALNTGMGSFRVTPSGTIAFDGNLDWAGAYVAQVSYSITTGP